MFNHFSNTQKGIALALTGYTSFAFADICVKWLTQHYSIYQVVGFDAVFSLLVCLAFLPLLGRPHGLFRKDHMPVNIMRGILNALIAVVLVYSFSILPLSEVYTIIFTKPFFAALLAMIFLGQKIPLRRAIIMIIGFAGVVIAMRPDAGFNSEMFMPLICTILIAGMFLLSKKVEGTDLFTLAFYPFIATAMLNIMAVNGGFVWPDISHWPIFILGGGLAAMGMICVSLSFIKADASLVSPFVYTEMIWAILFGFIIFGDLPTIWGLTGAAIIIISGLSMMYFENRKKSKAAKSNDPMRINGQ